MTDAIRRLHEDDGFTLVEILVVVLLIGILAAISVPAFLGQREKAQNASAKSMTRHAATAAETYAADNNDKYTSMTIGTLQGIEPSLNDGGSVGAVASLPVAVTATSYTVTTKSKSGTYFSLTRDRSSGTTRRCSSSSAPTAACAATDW